MKLCEAEIHTGYIAHGCKRVCCGPVEFSFGPWTPASWTIWMVEAVSSGSPDPDLPTPPAWHKLLLSSLHIISLSCSGINRPPASLSAPMCASRSVCAHSRQSSYPRFHKRVNIKELFHNYYCGHYGNLDCLKKQNVFSSVCCIAREDMIIPLSLPLLHREIWPNHSMTPVSYTPELGHG